MSRSPMLFRRALPLLLVGVLSASSLAESLPAPPAARPASQRDLQDLGRAQELLVANRSREAVELLREVLRRDPASPQARFLISSALVALGRPRDALDLLEKLLVDVPDHFGARNNLAWLLATSPEPAVRDPARAVRLAREALMLVPDNYNIWSTLSEAYFRGGDYDRALQAAEAALELSQLQKAPESNQVTYAEQIEKCRKARTAFALIE